KASEGRYLHPLSPSLRFPPGGAPAKGKWQREEIWVYPFPENVGLRLAVDQGNRVDNVRADSPAGRTGLRAGDVLLSLDGESVASLADMQFVLQRAPARGDIRITWQRNGRRASADLSLPEGWRVTDVSWRPSPRGIGPPPAVHGEDLT